MADFPSFVKSPANRVGASSEHTRDIEGYVFDGVDGSQAVLWTAHADRVSEPHEHAFDEWMFVLEGACTVEIAGARHELRAGEEITVPRGTLQSMGVRAGTRTFHVFGGRRAERVEPETPLPPIAVVLGFVDCINRNDLGGLARLMSDDHRMVLFDEPPLAGRAACVRAWRGYMESFPRYLIHPERIVVRGERVALAGGTTGSHLGLPDAEELRERLLWVAEVERGKLTEWRLEPDGEARRSELGLD